MQSRLSPAPITEHRLKRLTLWVRLTPIWAAAFTIAFAAPGNARAFVERMRGYAGKLLVARAMLRMPMPRQCARAHMHLLRDQRTITHRRILGRAFRRALQARGLIAQARAIAAVLANAEAWIARLIRRRLTRLTQQPSMQQTLATLHVADTIGARTSADTS